MTTGDARAEYAAVRSGAGVIDRREAGVLEATGRDRATFLHALLSNEIKALAPGRGCAATLLDIHGKVQVLLFVWVLDDRILLVTPSGMAAETLEALDKYLFSEKVVLRDASEDWALFLLAGPQAPSLLQRLTGAVPEESPWSSLVATIEGVGVRRDRGHVNRHLRGLVLDGDAVPPVGSEIVAGDAPIGAVTSATLSLGLGRPLALGLVRRQHAEPGTAVGVRIGERVVPATVSDLPFKR